MTSQDISRSLRESGENLEKTLLSQDMKHACERIAENVQQNNETREQYGAFVCSNNMKKTLAGNGVPTIHLRKGERPRSIGPHTSSNENDHLLNSSLAVQTSEHHMQAVSSAVSQKSPVSTFSSELFLDKSNESPIDNTCNKDLNTLQEKKMFGSARERYLSVIEIENSSSSFHNIFTAKSNHHRFESCRKDQIRHENNAKKNVSGDQVASVFNTNNKSSSSSVSSVTTPGCLNGKCITPKDLLKASETPSIHATSREGDSIFSEQGSFYKDLTSGSMNSVSLRAIPRPSPDMQTSKADPSMSGEILNSATVKSLKSIFGAMDPRPAPASASSSVCSQSSHASGTRVRIKPSFTIQRIQEQLLQKMENDEVRFSSSKTMQKLVHKTVSEQHQVAETNDSELGSKTGGVHTDKLHKEEKPYRQWHRMSRVVTADSKFIISPMLPCHPIAPTRQNVPVLGKPVELGKIEETFKTEEKQECSIVSKSFDTTTPVECPSCEPEERIPEDDDFHKVVVKTDPAEMQISLTNSDAETNEAQNGNDSIATHPLSKSDNGIQNTNQTATETKDNTENGNKKLQVELEEGTTLHESGLCVRRIPKYVASSSLPRNKSVNLKTLYMTKYQSFNELNEVSTSNTRDFHHCPASTDVVDKIKPLNSVSGASQVTGPSFSEFKNDPFKLPAKKVVSGCPKLRTATRTRNRCNSPGLTHGSTNLFRGAESQKAHSNLPRPNFRHSREGSRNTSSDRRSDSLRQREQRMSAQPRSARNARTPESDQDNPECINRNWSSRCPAAGEIHKESDVSLKKNHKVFLADVASKLMQKVNRASTRAARNEPSKKYTEVKATQDYNGSLPGQLSFRKGQIIKQRSFVAGPSDGMCYGYYRVGRLRKKKKGLFPFTCLVRDELDALDGVSLTSSAKSAM